MKKRVCILYYGWYKAPNGAAKFVRTLDENRDVFQKKNIDLHVFSLDTFMPKEFSDKDAINKRNSLKNKLLRLIKRSTTLMILYMWLFEERHHRRVVAEYLKGNFHDDIIHCQEPVTAYYLLKSCKKIDFQLYVSMHSNGEDFSMEFISRPCLNTKLGIWYLNRKLRYVIAHTNKIGFVSKNSLETYHRNHPETPYENLFYVYNGIEDNKKFRNGDREDGLINLICVGGLSARKNQECLIDAMTELTDEERNQLTLTFVGDGLIRSRLEEKVNRNSLSNVFFVGSSDKVTDYLLRSDVFILVSKDEGLPIAIIEAMSAGLPVIGSRVAGIPELIEEGVTGYVIEPNKSDVVSAIRMIINDKERIPEMGMLSRRRYLSMFTLEAMLEMYIKVYE